MYGSCVELQTTACVCLFEPGVLRVLPVRGKFKGPLKVKLPEFRLRSFHPQVEINKGEYEKQRLKEKKRKENGENSLRSCTGNLSLAKCQENFLWRSLMESLSLRLLRVRGPITFRDFRAGRFLFACPARPTCLIYGDVEIQQL